VATIPELPAAPDSHRPIDDDFARIAAQALAQSPYPSLVLEIPSELIVASGPSAALLLDPAGGSVVGHRLEEFTADRPTIGADLFAGGRLNGFEAFRVVKRPGSSDVRVRMWVKSFANEPASRYVLVVMMADKSSARIARAEEPCDAPAVVGTADASLLIDRISDDADSLFGWSINELLGQSLISLVAEKDVENGLAGLAAAADTQNSVALYVDVNTKSEGVGGSPIGCELLILPLQPAPSCAFAFLPTSVELSRVHVATDLSAILHRLGRGAEVAQLVRGATVGITERDLPGLSKLTTRELEVLTRLLDGDRAPAIAAELFLTQGTVRNHLASIFNKVGVTSQQELLSLFRAAKS
jgi:DNA-binding CsgD family transcriptional regulator